MIFDVTDVLVRSSADHRSAESRVRGLGFREVAARLEATAEVLLFRPGLKDRKDGLAACLIVRQDARFRFARLPFATSHL